MKHDPITTTDPNWMRVAMLAEEYARKPASEMRRLRVIDALRHCIDADLSDDIAACCHELRIDTEGRPLDGYGYPIDGAERRFDPSVDLGRGS